jgi:hypothetical protein
VREESHLDEMRSAIRGDFERLAERRGEQELMRVTQEVELAKSEHAAVAEAEREPEPEPEPERESEPKAARSWFARFVSS